jgi:hypothetical protein
MPVLQNCEVWFVKADPKRPNKKFNPANPTWEVQIRTNDKAQVEDWKKHGLNVKPIIPDDDPTQMYWRVNLRKKSIKEDGQAASAVTVVDAKLRDLDPNIIGNGSIANVRIYQYTYQKQPTGQGIATVFMGLQVTKLIKYTPKARDDDFSDAGDMEVVEEDDAETEVATPTPRV